MFGVKQQQRRRGGTTNPPANHTPLNFTFEGHGGAAVSYDRSNVYAVTNLNESGPGSLLDAPADSYVIFPNLSGDINATSLNELTFQQDNIWVMGQTSPSGIQIRGGSHNDDHKGLVEIDANNHIWQHVRVRPDLPIWIDNCCHKPFIFFEMNGGVCDHMSFYWGDDDSSGAYQSDGISFVDCIHAQGVDRVDEIGLEEDGGTGFGKASRGALLSRGSNLSMIRCLNAFHNIRGPKFQDTQNFDVFNCVTYQMSRGPDFDSKSGSPATEGNYEGCVQILGSEGANAYFQNVSLDNAGGTLKLFVNNNKVIRRYGDDIATADDPHYFDSDEPPGASGPGAAPASSFSSTRYSAPRQVEYVDLAAMVEHVLDNAGASHNRDSLDASIMNMVRADTGSIVTAPGPWPNMTGGSPSHNPWDSNAPDYLSDAIKIQCGIPAGTDTTQSNFNGGSRNDFLYIMDFCFGL